MNNSKQRWWQSKTIWSGLIILILNFYFGLDEIFLGSLPDIPPFVLAILNAIFGTGVLWGRSNPDIKPLK
jgi:hypothetical protein